MEVRNFHTRFYRDAYVGKLSAIERYFFTYLLINDKVNMCGIYELPDSTIKFDTALSDDQIKGAKLRLESDKKVSFFREWVYVHNFTKYNKFNPLPNIIKKFAADFNNIPLEVRKYFLIDTGIAYQIPILTDKLVIDTVSVIAIDIDSRLHPRLENKEYVDPDSVPDFGLPKTLKSRVASGFALLAIALLFSTTPVSAIKIEKQYQITSKYVTQHPVHLKTPVKPQQIASPTRFEGETPKQGSVLPVTSTVRNQQHPAPVYAPLPEFKKEVARKIKLAFPDDAREMIAIAMAESGLRCEAINHMDSNGVQSVGLFQINDGRLFDDNDIANLTNCDHNMTRAKQKYATQTKRAWGAFTNGAYQRYLWIFDEI